MVSCMSVRRMGASAGSRPGSCGPVTTTLLALPICSARGATCSGQSDTFCKPSNPEGGRAPDSGQQGAPDWGHLLQDCCWSRCAESTCLEARDGHDSWSDRHESESAHPVRAPCRPGDSRLGRSEGQYCSRPASRSDHLPQGAGRLAGAGQLLHCTKGSIHRGRTGLRREGGAMVLYSTMRHVVGRKAFVIAARDVGWR
jgi:hypothetical protein